MKDKFHITIETKHKEDDTGKVDNIHNLPPELLAKREDIVIDIVSDSRYVVWYVCMLYMCVLYVCVCVCMYMCVCVLHYYVCYVMCVCLCVYCVYICVSICVYVYIHVCVM